MAKKKRIRIPNMTKKRGKSVLGVTLLQLGCLLAFLLFLGLANLVNINNPTYSQVVQFLNESIGIIILFAVLFYLGELFSVFRFPFNLPVPLLNAFGGVFLVEFLFRVFYLIGEILTQGASLVFKTLEPWVFAGVFVIIVAVGYTNIFKYRSEKSILEYKNIELKKPKKRTKEKIVSEN